VEAWKKVFLDNQALGRVHAAFGCIACHGGVGGTMDMEEAHQGIIRHPDPAQTCAHCHESIVETYPNSLHATMAGFYTVLQARGSEETWPQLKTAFDNHCKKCHVSCGQCHVSRHMTNEGGLLAKHEFKKPPPMNLTCVGCHGTRVNDEYKGRNQTADGKPVPADVHFNPGGMTCFACHSGDQLHGVLGVFNHRYDGPPDPSCTQAGCHENIGGPDDPLTATYHMKPHMEKVQCQVCHAAPYKHCYNCHVQLSDKGIPYFKSDPSEIYFIIGKNPIQSPERPWEYVVLRHVPIARTSFAYYGENLLPNFDARETWTYATPHTIQRRTPQTESCDACHGNASLFLTEDFVRRKAPDEVEANRRVIVTKIP
jgi:thiosulfate/3-mercaptopyruvate sulfurtransferase